MNHLTGVVHMLAVALLTTGAALAAGPTGLLNDTGQTTCYDGAAMVACTAAITGDNATYPRQDGRFGRDAANVTKVGGGAAGFDFTKVCMNGTLNCTGAANTGASPVATEWACTKDNVTNLIWSLQTQGLVNWNVANAAAYPDAGHNSATRCGYSTGWRVPSVRELFGIVHSGLTVAPMVDINYFPGTQPNTYWTSDTYSRDSSSAWFVYFDHAETSAIVKTYSTNVRLVRSGQ